MVPQHADILDERESLKKPFAASVLFHAAVLALFAWRTYAVATRITLGQTNPGFGDSVAINSVKSIPLPARHGPVNPVANDTESIVPQREVQKPQPKLRRPEPVKNAIPLKSRMPDKPVQHDYLLQKYRNQPLRENQFTSSHPPAAISEMYRKPGSTAGVGINPNSVLGTQFGGYAQALMEAVARHWNTGGLAGVRAPIAIVSVDILRNGSIRNPKLVQASGNSTVDYSALRAVMEAAPLPPLPPDLPGSYLSVDFQFQLHP
jgi:protein TonB